MELITTDARLSFDEVEIKLQEMFAELRVPSTGITKKWLDNIVTLGEFIQEQTAIYGTSVIAAVQRLAMSLGGSTAGTWAIHQHLGEIGNTLRLIEGNLFGLESKDYDERFVRPVQSVGAFSFNASKGIPMWDDNLKRLIGYPVNKPTPDRRVYFDAIHPDYRDDFMRKIERLETAGVLESQHIIRRLDNGQERMVMDRARRITMDGDVMIVGTVTDLTDRPYVNMIKFTRISTSTVRIQ